VALRLSRAVLLGVLAYVTLDLSTPFVPGAFVFDVEDSIESVQGQGGRRAVEAATVPLPRLPIPALRPVVEAPRRPEPPSELAQPHPRATTYRPRASLAPASGPEDH
jgi:hypothetical protein